MVFEQIGWMKNTDYPFKSKVLPVWGDKGTDGDGSLQPLLHIQIAGRFVKHKTAAEGTQLLVSAFRFELRVDYSIYMPSIGCLLTCRPSGCRQRRRQTSAALLRTDPPHSSPAGDSDLHGNNTSSSGVQL